MRSFNRLTPSFVDDVQVNAKFFLEGFERKRERFATMNDDVLKHFRMYEVWRREKAEKPPFT